ncbi:20072_t:CDS:1 [Dentiscutata erythropus]|uniref:20072_t:CDS:1 n=1 Tax=Dentiscutata erythropus TaxID=1348616 RepID=A0A9N8Z250_9GLOM|nr:20072_t:CDS:1 [Dentiscutata erythropus]
MAASLPDLCLKSIFKELEDDLKSQYVFILINRHWCLSVISELWRNPFDSCNKKDQNVKIIDTYLKCLPQDMRNELGVESINSLKAATFDYPSFLRHINDSIISYSARCWATENFPDYESQSSVSHKIQELLCRLFVSSSPTIKGITIDCEHSINIFALPGAKKSLSQLEIFNCRTYRNVGCLPEILESALEISKKVQNLDIWLSTDENMGSTIDNMSKFIESQRNLKVILIGSSEDDFPILWQSTLMHVDTLVHIQISSIIFNPSPFQLYDLALFKSLEILEIEYCDNFVFSYYDKMESFAFQKMKRISLKTCRDFPSHFIEVLFSQAKENMLQVELFGLEDYESIFQSCIKHCKKITRFHGSIVIQQTSLLLEMLKTCKELQDILIEDLSHEPERVYSSIAYFDPNNFIRQLGEVMPTNVHMLTLKINWVFSSKSLDELFKKFKATNLRILDFSGLSFISDEHLEVIIKRCGGKSKELYLTHSYYFSDEIIEKARNSFRKLVFVKDQSLSNELDDFDDFDEYDDLMLDEILSLQMEDEFIYGCYQDDYGELYGSYYEDSEGDDDEEEGELYSDDNSGDADSEKDDDDYDSEQSD